MTRRVRGLREEAPGVHLQVSFRRALGFGPGKARLLLAIEESGSISAAAKALDMPFRRAWDMVAEMNAGFRRPLVLAAVGGNGGGGAALTPLGREVLERFARLDARVRAALQEDMAYFEAACRPGDGADSA